MWYLICSVYKTVYRKYSSITKQEKLFAVIIVTTEGPLKCYQFFNGFMNLYFLKMQLYLLCLDLNGLGYHHHHHHSLSLEKTLRVIDHFIFGRFSSSHENVGRQKVIVLKWNKMISITFQTHGEQTKGTNFLGQKITFFPCSF